MKILFQKITSGKDNIYIDLLKWNLERAKATDTEIEISIPKVSIQGLDHVIYRYFRMLNDREIIEGLIQSQGKNFDGILVGCFFDPCLREAREILNIPIVGFAEASFLLANIIGFKFAVITMDPKSIPDTENLIDTYGVRSKAISTSPVRSLKISLEEQVNALRNPELLIRDFTEVAKGCVADQADVVIPGCLLMSPILAKAGLDQVHEAVVLDCITVGVKILEVMVSLNLKGISWISRRSIYKSPPTELFINLRNVFPYLGSGTEKII